MARWLYYQRDIAGRLCAANELIWIRFWRSIEFLISSLEIACSFALEANTVNILNFKAIHQISNIVLRSQPMCDESEHSWRGPTCKAVYMSLSGSQSKRY